MPTKKPSPADVIREVIARTCQRPVDDRHRLERDLMLDPAEREELRVALELALRCELDDFEIEGGVTVADLIAALVERTKAA